MMRGMKAAVKSQVRCIALPWQVERDADGKLLGPDHFLTVGRTYGFIQEKVNFEGQRWFLIIRDDGKEGSYRSDLFEAVNGG